MDKGTKIPLPGISSHRTTQAPSIPPDSDSDDRQHSKEGREEQQEHEGRCHLSSSPDFSRGLAVHPQADLSRDGDILTFGELLPAPATWLKLTPVKMLMAAAGTAPFKSFHCLAPQELD